MAALVVTLIALGTLAFGAVYPWAYVPLLAAAAMIGLVGVTQVGVAPALRPVAAGLLAVTAGVTIQLIPLPADVVQVISPSTFNLLSRYDLAFAGNGGWSRLSIDPARTRLALFALVALGLYLVGLPGLLNGRGLRLLPGAIALVAVPLALFVIYTREHNNGLIYGFWRPLDGGGSDQAGPFINRNHFGGWIVMSLCLMIGWLVGRIERALPASGAMRRRKPIVADDVGAVLLMSTAIAVGTISLFWIVSRSAITSFGVAMAFFTWLVLKRRTMGNMLRAFVLVALAVILLAGVSWRGIDVLGQWFVDERSLVSRIDAWRDGWDVVRSFPVFGTGLNTYSLAMLEYQVRNPEFHMAQAHNDYLQLLAEGGVVIVAAVAVTIVLLIAAVRRTVHAASIEVRGYWVRAGAAIGLITIAFQELVEFSLQIPANALLFCTLAAITLTPVDRGTPTGAVLRVNIDVPKDAAGAALS